MADGILCKHCGWQETNHTEGDLGAGNPDIPNPGYKKTLNKCRGFVPEDSKLARQIKQNRKREEKRILNIIVEKNPN